MKVCSKFEIFSVSSYTLVNRLISKLIDWLFTDRLTESAGMRSFLWRQRTVNKDDEPATMATVDIATNTSDKAPCDSAVKDDNPVMNKHISIHVMYADDDDGDDDDVTHCSGMIQRLIYRTIMVYDQSLWLSFKARLLHFHLSYTY